MDEPFLQFADCHIDLTREFYAVQTGPLVEVPIERFYVTLRGGYQYTQTFQNGVYGGLELYFPFKEDQACTGDLD